MKINGTKINNFSVSEFPEDPVKHAEPKLILRLDQLRDLIGKPIYPSPVKGALARFSGRNTSRHYALNRLSDACDVFIEGDKFETYTKILRSNLFPRMGLYFDTQYRNKPWMMLHLDLKPEPLLWYRDITYHYEQEENFYTNLYKYLRG